MDTLERRGLIAVTENPETRIDYLSVLHVQIERAGHAGTISILMRYVPDRQIIEAAAWSDYVTSVSAEETASAEWLATTILADANDVAIARWMEIVVETADPEGCRHLVAVSDTQPGWSNETLLARLAPLGG